MGRKISIWISQHDTAVSGIVERPANPSCLLALAHGAGAGMTHPFMEKLAQALRAEDIATLRFNFLYMERGGRRPDRQSVSHDVLRATLMRAQKYADKWGVPLVAGGKSYGGRMFSQLAAQPDHRIQALVFYGFPLHRPGRPDTDRAAHLKDVEVPMLFLQGTRDSLAETRLIRKVCKSLRRATLEIIDDADHSFKMPKRTGVSAEEMIARLASMTAKWLGEKLK